MADSGIVARACPPRSIVMFWSPLPPKLFLQRERGNDDDGDDGESERDAMETVAPYAPVTYHRRVRGDLDDTLPKPCTSPNLSYLIQILIACLVRYIKQSLMDQICREAL